MKQSKKNYILSSIDQRFIYSTYLGIDIEDINMCLNYSSHRISNPLRNDVHPSLSFKYFGDKLILRDFADIRFRGDVFEIVGIILNLNCNKPYDFQCICDDIIFKCKSNILRPATDVSELNIIKSKHNLKIGIEPRSLNMSDIRYFKEQGIWKDTIEEFIIPVYCYYLDDKCMSYRYRQSDPCYAYYFGRDKFKLYFPYRDKNEIKFITNNRFPIENILKLTNIDYLILTKSYKDNCLITQFIRELNLQNIQALSISGETVKLNDEIVKILRTKVEKEIITLFDIDPTGIESTKYYEKHYGTIPWYFAIEHGGKDPTGMVKKVGYKTTLNRFKKLINELE